MGITFFSPTLGTTGQLQPITYVCVCVHGREAATQIFTAVRIQENFLGRVCGRASTAAGTLTLPNFIKLLSRGRLPRAEAGS